MFSLLIGLSEKMKNLFLILLFSLSLYSSAFSQETEQLDAFGSIDCEDYLARMDVAINSAEKNPAAKIYILVYEGKESIYDYKLKKTKLFSPPLGLAKAKIASMKKYISNFRNFPIERFVFINAGLREDFGVEFWSVPIGTTPPKPNPTLKKIKYRKGRAYGFCLGCCE